MDNKLNKLTEKCLPITPLSLAVTHDDCVIITTGTSKKLCIYQVNEDNAINEKEIISVKYSCDSISITSDNKCVVGTFGTDVDPVHFLSLNGEFEELLYDFEGTSFEGSMKFRNVYNEKDRQLIITDYDQNTVHVYNLQKTEHFKVEDTNIVKPVGIAHYLNDLYFICSNGTDSVVQLSTQGGLLTVDRLNGMHHPRSICISPDKDKLIVTNNRPEANKILLFKIH
jgi:hypothetical protein